MDNLAYLPLVLARVFDGRPSGYLAQSVGPRTADVLEKAWYSSKLNSPKSLQEDGHGEEPLAWLPGTVKGTFEDGQENGSEGIYVPEEINYDSYNGDDKENDGLTTDCPPSKYIKELWKTAGARKRKRRSKLSRLDSQKRSSKSNDVGSTRVQTCALSLDELSQSQPARALTKSPKRKATAQTSRFWSPTKKSENSSGLPIPAVPFPSLESTAYGLIQEELAHDPFSMLIAVIFLVKTKGEAAIPTLRRVLELYPTASHFATLQPEDLFPDIKHLGLANRRAEAIIELANAWIKNPPTKDKRFRRLHYPNRDDGKNIPREEQPLDDNDPRSAFEICHLPHMGPYAIDSWRIFCRDALRDVPTGLKAKPITVQGMSGDNADAIEQELQQEWVKVHPSDKELIGYVKWRWLRLGWVWNDLTGERKEISKRVLKKMEGRRVQQWQGLNNPWW